MNDDLQMLFKKVSMTLPDVQIWSLLQVLDRTSSWSFESLVSTKRPSRSWAERTPGVVDHLQWPYHAILEILQILQSMFRSGLSLWLAFLKPMFACICSSSRIPSNSSPEKKVYLRISSWLYFTRGKMMEKWWWNSRWHGVSPWQTMTDPHDRILLCDLAGSERLKKSDVGRPELATNGTNGWFRPEGNLEIHDFYCL